MNARVTPAPGPASVIELDMGSGRVCLGEYHWSGPSAAAVVLLHDEGLDLDSTRDLVSPLVGQGFSVLNLDLPGHGLSTGDYESDSSLAIAAAARFVDPKDERGVGFIGVGATSAHLMTSPVECSMAVVLIDPRCSDSPSVGEAWRSTPSLYFMDPSDPHAGAVVDALSGQLRAWNVRCSVHRQIDSAAPHDPAGAPHANNRMLHVRALSMKFLLEQRTYYHSRLHQLKGRA